MAFYENDYNIVIQNKHTRAHAHTHTHTRPIHTNPPLLTVRDDGAHSPQTRASVDGDGSVPDRVGARFYCKEPGVRRHGQGQGPDGESPQTQRHEGQESTATVHTAILPKRKYSLADRHI
jgi:hypothetical protein